MANYKLSLMTYPSGKVGFVGSIPVELCDWKEGLFPQYVPRHYDSKEEALQDAANNNVEVPA